MTNPRNLGAIAGGGAVFRNKIINGDMKIAQRGTSFSAVADGTFTADRWSYWHSSDGAVTITQDTDVPSSATFTKSLKVDVTTADASIAAGQYAFLRYSVEGYDFQPFVGKQATLSFWVKATKTGTYSISIRNSGNDRSYVANYTVSASDTWEFKTITLTFNYSGGTWDFTNGSGIKINFTLACGSTYAGAPGSWASADYRGSTTQVNALDSTSNNFWLTGVQLEVGATATPFEFRPYGQELALCQRYYYKVAPNGANAYYSSCGLVRTTTVSRNFLSFPVSMRIIPTALETSGTASDYILWHGGSTTTLSSIPTVSDNTLTGAIIGCTVSSGLTVGQACLLGSGGTANSYLAWSAEL